MPQPAMASRTRKGPPAASVHSLWRLRGYLRPYVGSLAIMLVGRVYPLLFADASGKADHGLAMALFWAMSAGLVRGVGFVPRWALWRWLFSGWACCAGLALAAWLRWGG